MGHHVVFALAWRIRPRYGEHVAFHEGLVGFIYLRSTCMQNSCMFTKAVWNAGYEGRGERFLQAHHCPGGARERGWPRCCSRESAWYRSSIPVVRTMNDDACEVRSTVGPPRDPPC